MPDFRSFQNFGSLHEIYAPTLILDHTLLMLSESGCTGLEHDQNFSQSDTQNSVNSNILKILIQTEKYF